MKLETKRHKLYTAVIGGVLGMVIAIASVSCLITAFDLRVDYVPLLVAFTALFAAGGAVGFSYRYGPFAVLGGVVLSAVVLWQCGAVAQTQALITRLSYTYDQAYKIGIIRFNNAAWYDVPTDLPMMLLAGLIALTVVWVVCRRRPVVFGLLAASVLPALCLVVTDTIPAKWCFFLLLAGVTVLLLTSFARRKDPEKAPTFTAMSAVAVVAALALLFTAVPQKGFRNPLMVYQNQLLTALGFEGYTAGTGEIDGVDLKGLGSRFFLQYPVLTVTSEQSGLLYLREEDYNVYTGYSWESDDKRADRFETTVEGEESHLSVTTEWYRAQLMVPYYPTEGVLFGDGREWNSDQATTYDWTVKTLPENWRELVPNEYAYSDESTRLDMRYYHTLPTETHAWAQEVLAKIITNERSATAIADTVAAYVRDSAIYEDDCKRMPTSEDDFAKWFMTDGESGYCVHFATSTAVLLRAAQVNTRYVTGYIVETVADEPTVVTADLEHAWVEYYEPALKMWIPLESTPAEIEKEEEPETTLPPTSTTHSDLSGTTTRPINPDLPEEDGFEIPWKTIGTVALYTAIVVGTVAAVIALVIGQRRWRLARRQKRRDRRGVNERALLLWRDAARMHRHLGTSADEALYALAQKAKFSQHTLTAEELGTLQDECDALASQLRRKPWYKRFVYAYVLVLY